MSKTTTNVTQRFIPHLEESLSALAQVAMQDAGADGFAYFRRLNDTGELVLSRADGARIPDSTLADQETHVIVSYPLGVQGILGGILAFAFHSRERADTARQRLNKLVATIEKVWATQLIGEAYLERMDRIIELEVELLDSKIVARAQGVITTGTDPDTIEAMARHVETVLRPSNTRLLLDRILRELEEEVEERKWAEQAKQILQASRGMSEAEAHAHLRRLSRTSRKRFIDVARQVVNAGRR